MGFRIILLGFVFCLSVFCFAAADEGSFSPIENSEVKAVVDLDSPVVHILSPGNLTYSSGLEIAVEIFVEDLTTDNIWYYLDSGGQELYTGRKTYNLSGGEHHLKVFANDSFGRVGFAEVYFYVGSSLQGCGDFVCSFGESCNSCGVDCGACVVDGGSGSGGSGGRAFIDSENSGENSGGQIFGESSTTPTYLEIENFWVVTKKFEEGELVEGLRENLVERERVLVEYSGENYYFGVVEISSEENVFLDIKGAGQKEFRVGEEIDFGKMKVDLVEVDSGELVVEFNFVRKREERFVLILGILIAVFFVIWVFYERVFLKFKKRKFRRAR